MKRYPYLLIGLCLAGPVFAESKEPPVAVRMVTPNYPDEMRRLAVSGVVQISCVIDERGNVTEPVVEKSTDAAFEAPAMEALKKWKFKPGTRDGSAVPVRVSIPIKFIYQT